MDAQLNPALRLLKALDSVVSANLDFIREALSEPSIQDIKSLLDERAALMSEYWENPSQSTRPHEWKERKCVQEASRISTRLVVDLKRQGVRDHWKDFPAFEIAFKKLKNVIETAFNLGCSFTAEEAQYFWSIFPYRRFCRNAETPENQKGSPHLLDSAFRIMKERDVDDLRQHYFTRPPKRWKEYEILKAQQEYSMIVLSDPHFNDEWANLVTEAARQQFEPEDLSIIRPDDADYYLQTHENHFPEPTKLGTELQESASVKNQCLKTTFECLFRRVCEFDFFETSESCSEVLHQVTRSIQWVQLSSEYSRICSRYHLKRVCGDLPVPLGLNFLVNLPVDLGGMPYESGIVCMILPQYLDKGLENHFPLHVINMLRERVDWTDETKEIRQVGLTGCLALALTLGFLLSSEKVTDAYREARIIANHLPSLSIQQGGESKGSDEKWSRLQLNKILGVLPDVERMVAAFNVGLVLLRHELNSSLEDNLFDESSKRVVKRLTQALDLSEAPYRDAYDILSDEEVVGKINSFRKSDYLPALKSMAEYVGRLVG